VLVHWPAVVVPEAAGLAPQTPELQAPWLVQFEHCAPWRPQVVTEFPPEQTPVDVQQPLQLVALQGGGAASPGLASAGVVPTSFKPVSGGSAMTSSPPDASCP
jgi:hypothetical protein